MPRCSSMVNSVGDGTLPLTDVAVDPIDGTTLTAYGRANAIAVIAVSERGTMFDPGPVRLHAQDRGRPRGRRLHRHHGDADAEPPVDRQGEGASRCATSLSSSSTANGTPA